MSAPPVLDQPGEPSRLSSRPVRRIACVLVSWKDAADVEEAVRSLAAARARVEAARGDLAPVLVVVGNGGGEESVRRAAVESIWPGAIVIDNAENRGLGPAANQAAAVVSDVDAFLFCNPDARADGDVFSALAAGFDARQDAVALAPRLLDPGPVDASREGGPLAPPDAEDQRTFQLRRLPRLSSDVRELLLWDHLFPDGPARRRARYADADRERPFDVEQAAGAVFAVRAAAFTRIGGFDERFVPAWYEDVDLCARLLALGPIVYWPQARFRHAGGVSSVRLGYDRFLPVIYENALRYRRKHYGFAARAVYRVFLGVGMVLRLAALPLRRHVPRPRREAARAYRAVLARAVGLRAAPRMNEASGAPV